ncbi:hypothetical protein P9273_08785 [Mesorhizobium sp. WSM4935]|uniref:ATP-dependent DNA ligase n=1 Tax=Mesorhizobium sp. WSM4935 TaxID=3038547 RepID=UPI0024157C07|nr:hypothetical protein [Mesorhizobium sp. WSM4935]MDG4875191.1 hypothetical protein [Mesorhizobium sp. WSM4935]
MVDKPPEGDGWIHELKFDVYRSQIVIDRRGVRIFTRSGIDWTEKYRELAKVADELNVVSAIIDGEIIVLNAAGHPDVRELRKAVTRRPHDLYFVAFDRMHLNGALHGAAFVTLNREVRHRLWKRVQEHKGPAPKGVKRPSTHWVKPGLICRVKHLRGEETLRHASLQDFREEERVVGSASRLTAALY